MSLSTGDRKARAAIEYAHQAERLSFKPRHKSQSPLGRDTAVQANFITPQDPVLVTASGGRLPAVSLVEAEKLNILKNRLEEVESFQNSTSETERERSVIPAHDEKDEGQHGPSGTLQDSSPSTRTHPLFPPLPLYGPPGLFLHIQCMIFRISSFFLSLAFLGVIVLGAIFTSAPLIIKDISLRLIWKDPNAWRPFYQEELRRRRERREAAKAWDRRLRRKSSRERFSDGNEEELDQKAEFEPTEGGTDPIVCDIAYYARRVGLDAEEYKVQTEDGFIIVLWHVFNPMEHTPAPSNHRGHRGPEPFTEDSNGASGSQFQYESMHQTKSKRKYPVLLMHGLLQSAGAYCATDDDSLAFFLCKSGYDVWLGNNRCGFVPEHTLLKYSDPRMWAWNIRQMGVMDLPALISRVLLETGFEKLGLVCHSQATAEAFVALAKEQRPDLGPRISVFCALAPAAYAGPLIGKAYFKFMRVISPAVFRMTFGIHAFIPFMMTMHTYLPGRIYGALGYRVFSFLFNWSDARWERDLRDRLFQFAPVYVSAESMRWWLGTDCFAHHKCILATREEKKLEDREYEAEDEEDDDEDVRHASTDQLTHHLGCEKLGVASSRKSGVKAWYDERVPPFALWVAGSDDLVDGRRLLRRFEHGREPHVNVVHSRVIEGYEHLDVLWAMDSVEKVGKEVRDVIWKTMPEKDRGRCVIPRGV
ncbi:MAG: hypothetical protein M1816_001143 [Peltula sp. TS41687]|nr:MAG: hypothetical protein M1816_001143 [Peltula sp. TS41687]